MLDADADIPDIFIMCLGDNDLITQVIYNLLENAAKFARKGSALYLGVTTLNGVAAMPDFGDLGNVMFNLDFKGVFTASGLILVFVCFFGDFFSTLSAEAITGALTGCRYDRAAGLDALLNNGTDGAGYQISAADMAALIAD